ncbi:MAG: tripartite tricarboxylate transporter substrate binding protein [Firmicutes bacterium]|nr:tripartite tricarboxylate transporter substrate binding protein [Bacillota bacterium]
MRKSLFVIISLFFLLSLAILAGCSQSGDKQAGQNEYPTKPVTYMIPFNPGGQSDLEARRQQPRLEEQLGQSVVIKYKDGGGGAVGWSELVNKKPDGYNIGGFNIPHIILQPLSRENAGYQTEQIVPVAIFQATPIGLAVPQNSPYESFADFIAAAKAKPGNITVGGSGTYSGHHLALLQLEKISGAQLEYVPFTGAAPQMQAFLGGHVQAILGNSNDLVQHSDKMKVLAIGSEERFKPLADVPTFKELGYDMTASIDRGVAVPPGTGEQIVKVLEDAFMEIANDQAVQEQMIKEGFEPKAMNAAEAEQYIKEKTETYSDILAEVMAAGQ